MSSTLDQRELMTKGVSWVAAAVINPEISELRNRLNTLERIVEKIKAQLDKETTFGEVFLLPSRETQEAITSYLKKVGEAYPSDIADALSISVKEVLAVISILKEEKKVAEV